MAQRAATARCLSILAMVTLLLAACADGLEAPDPAATARLIRAAKVGKLVQGPVLLKSVDEAGLARSPASGSRELNAIVGGLQAVTAPRHDSPHRQGGEQHAPAPPEDRPQVALGEVDPGLQGFAELVALQLLTAQMAHSSLAPGRASSSRRLRTGAAGRSRTPDQELRTLLLYPAELQPLGGRVYQ